MVSGCVVNIDWLCVWVGMRAQWRRGVNKGRVDA